MIVSPNVSAINVDSYGANSFTVSFANLTWKNYTTNATFGSITDYGYSVPQGWKVNGSTSSGATDIKYAGNSVTIESDMTHDGSIVIAPVNLCAANLGLGQYLKNIPIVRQRPGLTFQSVQFLCTSSFFQANNVPSWVTNYQWYADPSGLFNFFSSTSNPTTVSKNFNGQGKVGLLISGSACPYTFFFNNAEITGAPKLVGGEPTITTSLMLNHFHLLVRIRGEWEIKNIFINSETYQHLGERERDNFIYKKISKAFANLGSSYAQALNKM